MNRRLSIILGLTGVCLLLFVMLVTIPGWVRLTLARGEYAYAEQLAARGQGNDSASTDSSEELERQRRELTASFIQTGKGVAFLEALDVLASQHRVRADVAFAREPMPGKRQSIPLTVTVRGALPDSLAFLASAQQADPLLVVQTLTVSPAADEVISTIAVETLWE